MNIVMIEENDYDNAYRSEDGTYTMRREQGVSPAGNQFNDRWVVRKNGVYLDHNQYRYDLTEKFNFKLVKNNQIKKDLDWAAVATIMEANEKARALGFLNGTTNWAAFIHNALQG